MGSTVRENFNSRNKRVTWERRTILAVYGLNEDEKIESKQIFLEELCKIPEESKFICSTRFYSYKSFSLYFLVLKGTNYFLVEIRVHLIGKFGEKVKHDNGRRILDYSLMDNLTFTNKFFEDKEIKKQTTDEVKNHY